MATNRSMAVIAPIIPPTIVPPAEHMPTLVGKSVVTVVEATVTVIQSVWVVEDVGEIVVVVDMPAEGQEFLLSSAIFIIMVNNSHFVL